MDEVLIGILVRRLQELEKQLAFYQGQASDFPGPAPKKRGRKPKSTTSATDGQTPTSSNRSEKMKAAWARRKAAKAALVPPATTNG